MKRGRSPNDRSPANASPRRRVGLVAGAGGIEHDRQQRGVAEVLRKTPGPQHPVHREVDLPLLAQRLVPGDAPYGRARPTGARYGLDGLHRDAALGADSSSPRSRARTRVGSSSGSCRGRAPSRTGSARGLGDAARRTSQPWPVTPRSAPGPGRAPRPPLRARRAGRAPSATPRRPGCGAADRSTCSTSAAPASARSPFAVVACARRSWWRGRSHRGGASSTARGGAPSRRSRPRCRCG